MRLDQVNPYDGETRLYRVVIETPRGSRHKYAFDLVLNGLLLKKSLPEGMVFPFDFAFVPRTRGGDGDPVDALVLADGAICPGCIVPARIIGLIEADQRQEDGRRVRNDRFIAVADSSEHFRDLWNLSDLPTHILKQTEQFFVHYNELAGKRFVPRRVLAAQPAIRRLRASIQAPTAG